MNRFASRKGSALLIVLGLLAIMIASAVGFAAYMRFSRLPSSYLRRTSASRQLIKAALARAIDELDTSIANDPHPGIGGRANNKWSHRVFMGNGTNTTGSANITPLCLEALAYVPPPLVDPLRYYSLQSPTATWQEFGFDSGRYTWCALDVSDYFDVNRLVADAPRSSAANRRVSLSYIFEDVNHGKAGSGPTAWDKFMEEFRGSPDKNTGNFDFKNQTPLVSVADLNLALGRKGAVGNFFSPFCDYLNGDRTSFSTTGDRAGDEYLSRMTFVTDGLFPAVSGETVNSKGETVYDLNDGRYQPFAGEDLDNDGGQSPSPARILFEGAGMQDRTVWASRITGLGCAALFDYLDTDRVPVSLAIPTLERTPMICGVHAQIPGSAKLSLLKSLKYEDDDTKSGYSGVTAAGDGTVRTVQQVVTYKINEFASAFMGGEITTLVSFPFARNYDSDGDRSYSIDGKMSYFFSTENMPLRTGEGTALHIQTKELQGLMNTDIGQGLMSVALPETKTTVNTAGKNGDPASHIQRIPLTLAEGVAFGPLLAQDQYAFATITYVWQQTGRKNRFDGGASMTWSPSFEDAKKSGAAAIAAATSGLKFYRANGTAIANNDLVNVIKGGNTVVNLNAAVWLRVKDGDGNVVDMSRRTPRTTPCRTRPTG